MKKYINYAHQLLKKYKSSFIKSFVFVLLLTAIEVMVPVSLRWFIKEVEIKQTLLFLGFGLLAYVCFLLIDNLVNVGWYISLDKLGGKIMQGIREDLLNAISKAHYEDLLNIGKDNLKNILFTDVMNIFSSVALLSTRIIADIIFLIVFLVVSSYINLKLTLILSAASVLGFFISFISRKVIRNCSRKVNEEMKANNHMLNEYIDSLELIKTNNLDEYFLNKNKISLWRFIDTATQADKKQVFLKNLIAHFHKIVSIGLSAFLCMSTKDNSAVDLVFYLFVSDTVLQNSRKRWNKHRILKN